MSSYKLKMVLLGDSGVGKSCLISRYMYNTYNDYISATIGAQFMTKELLDGKFRIDIWDTAGQERFRSLIPLYIKGANIIVLVLDITANPKDRETQLEFWNHYIETQLAGSTNFKKILVYNKLDLNPNFKWDDESRFDYTIGVSCKKGLNIEEFGKIVQKASLELEPKLANSYLYRGRAYFKLNNKQNACEDWSKAGELGKAEAYEFIQKYCNK